MYKTMESPLLGKNGGAGSLDRFFIYGYGVTTYIIPISSVFVLGFWDVYMGSLVKTVFWSTTACIRLQHPQERVFSFPSSYTSLIHPHASLLSICLHLSTCPLTLSSRFIPSRFLAVLIRFTFAMLFARPLHHTLYHSITPYRTPHNPVSQTRCCSLFIVHSPCFVFSLPLLVSQKISHLPSWSFSRTRTRLILAPPRRLSVKMEYGDMETPEIY